MADVNVASAHAAGMRSQALESIKLDAWRAVFEKTNRIISGRPVQVKLETGGGHLKEVPAWSDGRDITLNINMVKPMIETKDPIEAVLRLKGLNYHELSHVLYTPRMSDELPTKVRRRGNEEGDAQGWWYAMNALEDQRIETWFTAMYGPSRRYFEAAVLQWLIEQGTPEAAILIYGRKFLPAHIRVKAGDVFVAKHGQTLYDEFKAVIDPYLTITLPRESNKAFLLVAKYRDLLRRVNQNANVFGPMGLPKLVVEDNGASHQNGVPKSGDMVQTGRILASDSREGKAAAQKAVAKADKDDAQAKADAEAAQAAAKAEADAKAEAKAEAGDGQGAQGKGEDGNGAGASASAAGQGQSTQDDGGSGISDSGVGRHDGMADNHQTRDAEVSDGVRDLLKQAHDGLDDVRDDKMVQAEARRVLDAVKASTRNGLMDAQGQDILSRASMTSPSSGTMLAMRRTVNTLRKIRQEVEPQILHRQHAGRVDVRRLLTRNPNDFDIFTTYDEGAEEMTGIEAVVLVDMSGSMNHVMTQTCEAMWVMKRALDKLDIRCTVIMYDTEHKVVYQPSKKAGSQVPMIGSGGGTDPTSALKQATRILTKSTQPNKVLVTLTDGAWGGQPKVTEAITRGLARHGVHTMLLGLNKAVSSFGKHGHEIGHDIDKVEQLPKAMLKLVASIMRSASNQV